MFPIDIVSNSCFQGSLSASIFLNIAYLAQAFLIIIFSAEKISDQMILYHGLYTSKNYELDFKNCDELDSASGITFCTLSRDLGHVMYQGRDLVTC